jgi:hypothetical protein
MEYNPSGFDPCVDIPIPYPSSPFYGSEIDFSQPPRQDDFGSSLMVPALSIRDGYSTPPLSQDVLTYDNAYVLPQGQPEPFFYDTDTNSPSPPACDEPHTPESQGDCYMGRYPSTEGAYFLDDISADYQG